MDKKVHDYLAARRFHLLGYDRTIIWLIGCGGTGSWLATHIARLVKLLRDQGKYVEAVFVDPDTVEEKNIYRQMFSPAEIGRNKAVTLATRYNLAWGLDIHAVAGDFAACVQQQRISYLPIGSLLVIMGAVDNRAARLEIAQYVERLRGRNLVWIDAGNGKAGGQCLIGNAGLSVDTDQIKDALSVDGLCSLLPYPHVQMPDLVAEDDADSPDGDGEGVSCAEMALSGKQGLMVNARMAVEAANMLYHAIIDGLPYHGVHLSLESGQTFVDYNTESNILSAFRRVWEDEGNALYSKVRSF